MRPHPDTRTPETRNRRRVLGAGTAALGPAAAAGVIGIRPAWFGLSTTPVVLHALSFRALSGSALMAAGTIGLASSRIGGGSGGHGRPWRRLTGGSLLLVAGLIQAGIVARRGWAGREMAGRADLVVVSLNSLGGAATPPQIAALVTRELNSAVAAMISLPETSAALARQVAELLAARGHRFQTFSTAEGRDPTATTSLLISSELGRYRQLPAPKMLLGGVLAGPVDGWGPTLAAVHPGAPTPTVGFGNWRRYVTSAVRICRENPDSVVAGDFNATVDHAVLRNLGNGRDCATEAGRGAEGTWPARFPAPLAAPIDHILVNGAFTVLGTRTERVGGSDHRALIARLLVH